MGQNILGILPLRLVQEGFRGGKTPRKAFIRSMAFTEQAEREWQHL
jgi:hypothetical protein